MLFQSGSLGIGPVCFSCTSMSSILLRLSLPASSCFFLLLPSMSSILLRLSLPASSCFFLLLPGSPLIVLSFPCSSSFVRVLCCAVVLVNRDEIIIVEGMCARDYCSLESVRDGLVPQIEQIHEHNARETARRAHHGARLAMIVVPRGATRPRAGGRAPAGPAARGDA